MAHGIVACLQRQVLVVVVDRDAAAAAQQRTDLIAALQGVVVLVGAGQDHLVEQRRDVVSDERSEEHTSELQVTNAHLVCRLLLEKKNQTYSSIRYNAYNYT